MSLKFRGRLCVMIMKNDPKFEQECTCQFKIDMRNLTNFDPSTQKSQKFALEWPAFDQSIQCSSLATTEELYLMILKINAKFEGKLTCAFENDMRHLANFHQTTLKNLNIGTFIGSFY